MNFFDEIKQFNGLKFRDAEYVAKTKSLTANFLYNPTLFVLADNATKIDELLKQCVEADIEINTKFTKCSLDENAITLYVYTSILNNFPALSKEFHSSDIKVEINNLDILIVLKLIPQIFDYATNLKRESDIKAKLEENFYGNFTVRFAKKEDYIGEDDAIESHLEFQNSIKMLEQKVVYKVTDIHHIFGNTEYNLAIDFANNSDNLAECTVCGELVKVDKRSYQRKHTVNGETSFVEKAFYTLTIKNDGKFLSCSIFPRSADENKGDLLEIGRKIAMLGKFESYKGRMNFVAKTLGFCNYEKYTPPVKYKSVNEKYHTIFPVEYVDYNQADMFAEEEVELKEKDKSFVVFDLETTGLDSKTCEIIEIGAVKIEGGKIVSTFSTFVKPEKEIPQEITDLTTITNKMVEDSPAINYVLPDFYKYCHGASLVAHNISFDYGFLANIATRMGYNFDNPQFDTLNMAREKLLGLRNFKLETIAERLGVSLVGAHRAVNDAMATAKCFLKLL